MPDILFVLIDLHSEIMFLVLKLQQRPLHLFNLVILVNNVVVDFPVGRLELVHQRLQSDILVPFVLIPLADLVKLYFERPVALSDLIVVLVLLLYFLVQNAHLVS